MESIQIKTLKLVVHFQRYFFLVQCSTTKCIPFKLLEVSLWCVPNLKLNFTKEIIAFLLMKYYSGGWKHFHYARSFFFVLLSDVPAQYFNIKFQTRILFFPIFFVKFN